MKYFFLQISSSHAKIYTIADGKFFLMIFLQSNITPYILLCSVGSVHFEGKVFY